MNTASRDHEARICSAVDQVLASYRDATDRVGLQLSFKGIVSEGPPGDAEARIGVYQGKNWIDSLEFFVRRGGTPVTTPAEVTAWLIEQLEHLVADYDTRIDP